MKICSICQQEKQDEQFNIANPKTGTRRLNCKACQSGQRKLSYKENKAYYLKYAKDNYPKTQKRREKLSDFLREYKTGKPCADCGIIYPHYIMDFDHLPQHKKSFQIAKHGKLYSKDKLVMEMGKCELVCSNCHRERTWRRNLAATASLPLAPAV